MIVVRGGDFYWESIWDWFEMGMLDDVFFVEFVKLF